MHSAGSLAPTAAELSMTRAWTLDHWGQDALSWPFSFQYGGRSSAIELESWKPDWDSMELDEFRLQRTLTLSSPDNDLQVRAVIVEYRNFPTLEWTVYLNNTGSMDTRLLSDIQALDIDAPLNASENENGFILHHFSGGYSGADAYRPYRTLIGPGAEKRLGAFAGRPTSLEMSYFNIEGQEEGLIVSVGWPGQWSAQLNSGEQGALRIVAGQELTRFVLHPGEEVRTPLIVLQFWQDRDWIDAQNIWRRWMKAHNMPRIKGQLPAPMVHGGSNRVYFEMVNANEENQLMFIDRYLEEGLEIDNWWMDAGWYRGQEATWKKTGTWEVDTDRFPRGLRTISDYAYSKGIGIIVWFEPERVDVGTWLSENHPEWILGPASVWRGFVEGEKAHWTGQKYQLLDLGNPDVRAWLTDHVDGILTDQDIDIYRQDCNISPLMIWRENDSTDRQGITENKHVMGYLAYWDELARRHPDVLIDACAGGGQRNDVETMRRAVPLWRSDYQYEPIGVQCQTYGISFWLPYFGGGNLADANVTYHGDGYSAVDPYAFWSACFPSTSCGIDMRVREIDYAVLRRLYRQLRGIVHHFYGDFYPLTPYSLDNNVWLAWQFNSPEEGGGMVQAFRREDSICESARFGLRGLDPEAIYTVKHLDGADTATMTGHELRDEGLLVTLPDQPQAGVITYARQD